MLSRPKALILAQHAHFFDDFAISQAGGCATDSKSRSYFEVTIDYNGPHIRKFRRFSFGVPSSPVVKSRKRIAVPSC